MTVQTIPVRELNQHTSAVLARVQTGEELLISISGRPVARLSPLDPTDDYLLQLARDGRAILATDTSPFPMPPMLDGPAVNVAELYAQQREDEERW